MAETGLGGTRAHGVANPKPACGGDGGGILRGLGEGKDTSRWQGVGGHRPYKKMHPHTPSTGGLQTNTKGEQEKVGDAHHKHLRRQ